MANPKRQRLKAEDVNISMWLQNMAKFTGAMYRKYTFELAGTLQYITNKVRALPSAMVLRGHANARVRP